MKRALVALAALAALLTSAVPGFAQTTTIKADLTWTDNSNNETGFRVERRDDPGTVWATVGTVNENVTTFSDTALAADRGYCWRVFAFNAAGSSAPSNEACGRSDVPTPPSAPGTVSVSVTVTITP